MDVNPATKIFLFYTEMAEDLFIVQLIKNPKPLQNRSTAPLPTGKDQVLETLSEQSQPLERAKRNYNYTFPILIFIWRKTV